MKSLLSFSVIPLTLLAFAVCFQAQAEAGSPGEGAKITLAVGNEVFPAILYNTPPAKDLLARLPVTVTLNRGPVDYCGGMTPINYGKEDVQAGYRSGDLAYWIPGQDFVIFTETKDASAEAPDLVIIGRVSTDIEKIRALGSTIEVTIAPDKP